jgi:hypothetical protein
MKKLIFSGLAIASLVATTVAYSADPSKLIYLDDVNTPVVECVIPVANRQLEPTTQLEEFAVLADEQTSDPAECKLQQAYFIQ